jgi:hypothetical protein
VLTVKDIFLTGMSYLEINDLSKAISSYQVVIADMKGDKIRAKRCGRILFGACLFKEQ